jgi:hypothetical protein
MQLIEIPLNNKHGDDAKLAVIRRYMELASINVKGPKTGCV